jgi:hypothetical protein
MFIDQKLATIFRPAHGMGMVRKNEETNFQFSTDGHRRLLNDATELNQK